MFQYFPRPTLTSFKVVSKYLTQDKVDTYTTGNILFKFIVSI